MRTRMDRYPARMNFMLGRMTMSAIAWSILAQQRWRRGGGAFEEHDVGVLSAGMAGDEVALIAQRGQAALVGEFVESQADLLQAIQEIHGLRSGAHQAVGP